MINEFVIIRTFDLIVLDLDTELTPTPYSGKKINIKLMDSS